MSFRKWKELEDNREIEEDVSSYLNDFQIENNSQTYIASVLNALKRKKKKVLFKQLGTDETIEVELTPWIATKMVLGIYDLLQASHDILNSLYKSSFSIYNSFGCWGTNKKVDNTICTERKSKFLKYECGVCTASRLGKYIDEVKDRASKDPLLKSLIHNMIIRHFIPKLIEGLEKARDRISEILEFYDSLSDNIVNELMSIGIDIYEISGYLDELLKKINDAIQGLNECFYQEGRKNECKYGRSLKKIDEILDDIDYLAGFEYPDYVLRGHIEKMVENPETVIKIITSHLTTS